MASDTGARAGFREFWTLVFSMLVLAGPATTPSMAQTDPDTISGTPEVIDADILKFGLQRVILWGIDAPERK